MEEEVVKDEALVTEEPKVEEKVTPQPGEKTDPALLLKSLQETRAKLKEKDELIAHLQTKTDSPEVLSRVEKLERELAEERAKETLSALQSTYPALKDKSSEFNEYLSQNPGVSMVIAAKAFLVDHQLLETPTRKGLEKSTGGPRAPVKQGLSVEEIEDLRVNNYRKYSDMIRKGEIKFD